jgi:hypothetical protein
MTQPRPGVSATSAGSPTDPADPWSVDGSVPHQLSTSSAAPPHATYDPLDWPDSTEASNNIHITQISLMTLPHMICLGHLRPLSLTHHLLLQSFSLATLAVAILPRGYKSIL